MRMVGVRLDRRAIERQIGARFLAAAPSLEIGERSQRGWSGIAPSHEAMGTQGAQGATPSAVLLASVRASRSLQREAYGASHAIEPELPEEQGAENKEDAAEREALLVRHTTMAGDDDPPPSQKALPPWGEIGSRQAGPLTEAGQVTSYSAGATFIVEDANTPFPTQMRKTEFLDLLERSVRLAVEEELVGAGRRSTNCPYIQYWFAYYRGRTAAKINGAILKFAPESAGLTQAADLIGLIISRIRASVNRWASTGRIPATNGPLIGAALGASSRMSSDAEFDLAHPPVLSSSLARSESGESLKRETDDETRRALNIRSGLIHGEPLKGDVRGRMEAAFDLDFSRVRIHSNAAAAELCSSQDALAFTVGTDIAFASGQYQPATLVGQALLTHELAHVVQQRDASEPGFAGPAADPVSELEDDADQSAVRFVSVLMRLPSNTSGKGSTGVRPVLRSGLRLSRCNASGPGAASPGSNGLPTLKLLEAVNKNPPAMTTEYSPEGTTQRCTLGLGSPSRVGMTFNSEVEVPAGNQGKLEFLQLVDRCLEKQDLAGNYTRRKTNGYALDVQDPYPITDPSPMDSMNVTSPGTVSPGTTDSPGSDVAGFRSTFIADDFKMFLMWAPATQTASQRVPLGMVTWSWAARGTKTGSSGDCVKDWTVSDADVKPGKGGPTSETPNWTKVCPRDFPFEPGKCD